MNIPEILPCPFCGGPAKSELDEGHEPPLLDVWCGDADCAGFDVACTVDQWNRRQPTPEAADTETRVIEILHKALAGYDDTYKMEQKSVKYIQWGAVERDMRACFAHPPKPEPTEEPYTQADYDRNAIKIPADVKVNVPSIAKPPAEWMADATEEIIHNYLFNAVINRGPLQREIKAIIARHYSARAGYQEKP